MPDPRLDYARKRYTDECSLLGAFKTNIELSIRFAFAAAGLEATVTGRVKALESIIKKLIRKPRHTYRSLTDKVGIRVITNDTTKACDIIRERFNCLQEDDKARTLGPDRLGYP